MALGLGFTLAGFAGMAQNGTDTPGWRYDLRVWQADEGLPQNTVSALAQTREGYLWVGTREGLARFDGVRFGLLDETAPGYLKHSAITALLAARDGSLWIACENQGLTRWQAGGFTHFMKTDGLPDNQVQCLWEDRAGSLWIGGETGLVRFKDGRFAGYAQNDPLRNNSIKALYEDEQGILRVATVKGLVSINAEGLVSADNFGLGPVTNVLKAVRGDRSGRLWLGATDGLICLTDGRRVNYTGGQTLPERITTCIHEDQAGQLWAGTYGGLRRRGEGLQPSTPGKVGVEDVVNTIFEDREQTLWIGGRDGLYRLSRARFAALTKQDGLNGNNVVSVLEDRTGAMWFGTWDGGVTRLKENQFTVITSTNGLTSDRVLSLHESRAGGLYVGTDLPGEINLLSRRLVNDLPPVSFFNAPIRVIHEDDTGTLWAGTGKGLYAIRGQQFNTYTTTNGLAGSNVTAICPAGTQLWIGTDGGLSRWTGAGFVNLTTRDGLSHNYVNAIYEDAAHALWVGTKGGGVNRIQAGKITSYTTREGLFNDDVYEILEDDSGHLWMSCRRGIFRVNRSQFEALDRGEITQLNCTAFGREDGLATVQCNGVAKPAGWKSQDGRLWFPTIRGVVAVASGIKINERPPPVVIEEIVVDGRALAPVQPPGDGPPVLRVPPGRGRLEIHYTALSLRAADKNHFKHRLTGVDDEWVDAGHQRVAYYNAVRPGRYQFQVIASNNDGVWNDAGAKLTLLVAPHFWQTWWFRAVLIAAPIGLVMLFYQARAARRRGLENLRTQIAADLHDDVGSRLTKVAMMTELADRETPPGDPGKPHLQNIARSVRDITRAMDEIVWTINPQNDTLENLANYIFHYAQEYFQDTGVRCRLNFPPDLSRQRISTRERHHLFMAVKEALNNVLKHAAATEVRIGLLLTDKHLLIEITDNGRGLAGGRPDPTGAGLANMQARLAEISGEFQWHAEPAGTTITLRLPGKWSD
jgi:ligand-binding sensor domain-containing protein/signal transduction histidine kinase